MWKHVRSSGGVRLEYENVSFECILLRLLSTCSSNRRGRRKSSERVLNTESGSGFGIWSELNVRAKKHQRLYLTWNAWPLQTFRNGFKSARRSVNCNAATNIYIYLSLVHLDEQFSLTPNANHELRSPEDGREVWDGWRIRGVPRSARLWSTCKGCAWPVVALGRRAAYAVDKMMIESNSAERRRTMFGL